jgi:hypothetical protein
MSTQPARQEMGLGARRENLCAVPASESNAQEGNDSMKGTIEDREEQEIYWQICSSRISI